LSARHGALHLSEPLARHGARLPFDFLLNSLALTYGARAICVILSGTGSDGSLGLRAIRAAGGLVIAQDPAEAGFEGMPRSAMATGAVDLVLNAEQIAAALLAHERRIEALPGPSDLSNIITLLREKTAHDFRLYKPGTLERRIARRMTMAGISGDDAAGYLALLQADEDERDKLAEDLLINVTSFFRDPKIFETLAETIIPEIVGNATADRPIRVWVAGCSTGEETYSLTMLFRERMSLVKCAARLQVFASDVDPQAVLQAREGLYPPTIAEVVAPSRLARFFTREEAGYRVSAELRAAVVFTAQDLLADPPFSKLDMISCRNLLIYMQPQAQSRIISIFNFALRQDGILLLGSAETVGAADTGFLVVSKADRLYRKVASLRPGELRFPLGEGEPGRLAGRLAAGRPVSRQAALAEFCRRLMMERFAPAAVLVNTKLDCLYYSGPAENYLRIAPGFPTHELLAILQPSLRIRTKSAITQALASNTRTTVSGGRTIRGDIGMPFIVDVQPVMNEAERLLLICFIDQPARPSEAAAGAHELTRVGELERELEATRGELKEAIRSLEVAGEEQNAINEEALSVNEEYQSTNEELLTSKEELQSLNEELTALNGQLQETLERQRTTANDLQNVLFSTDVATLFLDLKLNIRFFTPATKSLFTVIPSDVGRPLTDLHSIAADDTLTSDAAAVMRDGTPREREVETQTGVWFSRRILPYRTHEGGIAGVVMTFTDITGRKRADRALAVATMEAERANVAKSRFLAAASHDLRQPLQTLTLLKGLLAKQIDGEPAQKLLTMLDDTIGAMSGMLNTLLDINQIDAGIVKAEMEVFPINELLRRLRDEFGYHADARGLELRVVACGLLVRSDRHLLEQMLRNLLSNALKYTRQGRVLIGCRRRGEMVSIEVWDSGIGIADHELKAIFEEYHQVDNVARERGRGLGLGLSIVQRLGGLLGHRVRVRSRAGKGSVFSIEVAAGVRPAAAELPAAPRPVVPRARSGEILIVEDDPDIRELLAMFLREEGFHTAAAADGPGALALVASGFRPHLVLADYNLPDGMNGLQVSAALRDKLLWQIPVIILTGDISTDTLHHIARENCTQLNKPMTLSDLTAAIVALLPAAAAMPDRRARAAPAVTLGGPVIYVVDDDPQICQSIAGVLRGDGRSVETFASGEAFFERFEPARGGCLLIDAYMPGMSGLELLRRLALEGHLLPSIMITGHSDVKTAVQAMKAGAADFIEKPIGNEELLASVKRALERSVDSAKLMAWRADAAGQLAALTPRQRQIMELVLAGQVSKNIAADLGISQRTVENHRAAIMAKTGAKSLPALARLALAAAGDEADRLGAKLGG
jgi:two-component system CheB/CheR fusion protein